MPGRPAPRTWLNRQIVTHEDLQEEVHDWHVNDPLGLARNAGEEFAAIGEREIRVQAPPTVPSVKFHSGVAGTVAEWKPQSEIGGGSGGSGILGTGYYEDIAEGTNELDGLGQGKVKLLNNSGGRVTNRNGGYPTIRKMLFNDEAGSTVTGNVPSDFVDADVIFDKLNVGDFVILTSDQELGDIARFRVSSLIPRPGYYEVNVTNIANVGTLGRTGNTWQVQTISRSVVNAADLFGIAPNQLSPIADNTRVLVDDDDTIKWVNRSQVTARVAAKQNGLSWQKTKNQVFRDTWTTVLTGANNWGDDDIVIIVISPDSGSNTPRAYTGSVGRLGNTVYSLGASLRIRRSQDNLQMFSVGSTDNFVTSVLRISASQG